MSRIKAITFDVGHTLIEPVVPIGQVYAEVAAEHGFGRLSPAELEARFRAAFHAHGAVNTREDWVRIVDDTFAGLVSIPPSQTFFPVLFEHFKRPEAWRVFDDILPTLAALEQRGLRLGVISNWDVRLRPLLTMLDLAKYFEVIVISCEAGHAKPDREIFEQAQKSFSLSPAELFHVGDSLEADVLGARAVGFGAVRIARGQPACAEHLSSLLELLPLVDHGRQ